MHISPLLRRLAAGAALVLAAAGCGAPAADDAGTAAATSDETAADEPAEEGLLVVATTAVLGDVVSRVVGADPTARVEVLMEPGVDPHGFAPSAADGVLLREADLVVANGLQLEEGLLSALEAAEEDGVTVLHVAEELDPIEYAGDAHDHGEEGHSNDEEHGDEEEEHAHDEEEHDDEEHGDEEHGDEEHGDEDEHAHDEEKEEDEHAHDDEEHGDEDEGEHAHEHGALDPHVWLDPVRVADMAGVIAEAYTEIAPDAAGDVRTAAEDVAAEFAELDAEITDMLADLSEDQRRLVTNHEALGYFADRYDLDVIGTVIPGSSTSVDTSAESFTDLVELLRDTGVRAVFAETTASDRLANALSEEVEGVTVTELYTGSPGEPGSGAETLAGMLRTNAERIADALR